MPLEQGIEFEPLDAPAWAFLGWQQEILDGIMAGLCVPAHLLRGERYCFGPSPRFWPASHPNHHGRPS